MLMIITPLRQLSEVSNPITRGIALLNESKEFIETSILEPSKPSSNIPHHHDNLPSNSLNGEIIFENVSFTYPGNQNPTLNLISFEIKSGEHVAFIGTSGSGKTTIINLLPRFIERDQGHIYIDGTLIDEYDIQKLRNKISLVSQNIILLNASVYDNICMSEEIDKEQVDEILIQLKLEDLIEKNYNRSSINLGHNSSLISGGQRQRIALARAIYRDSAILILDEATSSLDSETDEIIRLVLSSYSQGKTIVSISHKLTTVMDVDKIFLIENGAVVDSGTHHELMTSSSRYKYMFDKN
jgi:subfamily B ATP-binding cassette protein MsbA